MTRAVVGLDGVLQHSVVYCNREGWVGKFILQYTSLYCRLGGLYCRLGRQCVTIQFLYRDWGNWVRLKKLYRNTKILYCD